MSLNGFTRGGTADQATFGNKKNPITGPTNKLSNKEESLDKFIGKTELGVHPLSA
jgi:hypothetical protein